MSLFKKAAEKAKAEKPTTKKKATMWTVGDPEGDQVAKAVHALVELAAQEKAISAKKRLHKTIVENFAFRSFVETYAELGVHPETPLQVVNADGEKVSYIVQDRSAQYGVKDEQKEALVQLLGDDAAEELLFTETTIKLSREAMAKPGVSEAVEKALMSAAARLMKAGVIEDESELIDVDEKEAFKPGTLQRLGMICGKDTGKIKCFLEAMGSSATRYVKA